MATAQSATSRSWSVLALWLGALFAGLWIFHQLGGGALEPPPPDPAGWGAWGRSRDPLVATFALLRLAVLGIGWYLLVATVLGAAVRLARAPRLVRVADRVTLPALRRFLRETVGVSAAVAVLATGPSVVGVAPSAAATTEVADVLPVLQAREVDAGGVEAEGVDAAEVQGEQGATGAEPHQATRTGGTWIPLPLGLATGAQVVGDSASADAADGSARVAVPTTAPPAGTAADVAAAPPSNGDVVVASQRSVVVQPGDSLWRIAEVALADHHGTDQTEAAVAAYWHRVIEHNRADLPDPDDPDLLFPGEVVVLPPIDAVATP